MDYELALSTIGFCACLYAAARLLHYISLYFNDNDLQIFSVPLICISFFLYFLALPVTVVLYLLNKFHSDRLQKLIQKDEADKYHQLLESYKREYERKSDPIQNPHIHEKRYNVTTFDGHQLCLWESDLPAFRATQTRRIQEYLQNNHEKIENMKYKFNEPFQSFLDDNIPGYTPTEYLLLGTGLLTSIRTLQDIKFILNHLLEELLNNSIASAPSGADVRSEFCNLQKDFIRLLPAVDISTKSSVYPYLYFVYAKALPNHEYNETIFFNLVTLVDKLNDIFSEIQL